jgi:uncharacterized protein YecT (DUF1311 family)
MADGQKAVLMMLPLMAAALIGAPAQAAMFDDGYKPCGDQPNTMATVNCVDAKTKVWDQRLNNAYKALAKLAEPGQQGPLKAAQRLWIQFRDANCRFYGSQEGTIRDIKAAECLRATTEDRALELEQEAKP